MEMIAGAAIVCLAAAIAIWANDHLPYDANEEKMLLEIPSRD
jgi:hypothetical protein